MKNILLALTLLASTSLISCAHKCHSCGGDKATCKMDKEKCGKCHDAKCDGKNCKENEKAGCTDCKEGAEKK
jgi:hypothetical protein